MTSHGDEPGTIAWRLQQVERTVVQLERKVDRLTWALAMAAVSLTCATIASVLIYFSNGTGAT